MEATDSGMMMEVMDVQLLNAYLPTDLTEKGIVTEMREVQLEKV